MASNITFSTTLKNARGDAITTAIGNAGLLRIYDGTQPAGPGTAISTQTLLAELTCGSPFAGSTSSGVLTANSITSDSSANATGTAAWARIVKSDGTTAVMDCTVGTSGADINLVTTSIVSTQPVAISSWVLTEGG